MKQIEIRKISWLTKNSDRIYKRAIYEKEQAKIANKKIYELTQTLDKRKIKDILKEYEYYKKIRQEHTTRSYKLRKFFETFNQFYESLTDYEKYILYEFELGTKDILILKKIRRKNKMPLNLYNHIKKKITEKLALDYQIFEENLQEIKEIMNKPLTH